MNIFVALNFYPIHSFDIQKLQNVHFRNSLLLKYIGSEKYWYLKEKFERLGNSAEMSVCSLTLTFLYADVSFIIEKFAKFTFIQVSSAFKFIEKFQLYNHFVP